VPSFANGGLRCWLPESVEVSDAFTVAEPACAASGAVDRPILLPSGVECVKIVGYDPVALDTDAGVCRLPGRAKRLDGGVPAS
jgi:hypothetical protein